MNNKLGFSGSVAKHFQDNALTPLLAVAALLMGLFAVAVTPREEEPQIDVTAGDEVSMLHPSRIGSTSGWG